VGRAEKKEHRGETAGGEKSGVGKKSGKSGKGIFKPLERVCILDDSGVQPREKNAKFETFDFGFFSKQVSLQK
jgi:hypothetical protein